MSLMQSERAITRHNVHFGACLSGRRYSETTDTTYREDKSQTSATRIMVTNPYHQDLTRF
jgi:hypothetical protein